MRPQTLTLALTAISAVAIASVGQQSKNDATALASPHLAETAPAADAATEQSEPCPLRMNLKLGPSGTTLLAKGPAHSESIPDAHGNRQPIVVRDVEQLQIADLDASNLGTQDIVAIDAHVQGFSGRPRMQPLRNSAGAGLDDGTSQALHLDAEIPGSKSRTVSLSYKRTIVTQYVQIDRILFRDGSAWQRTSPRSCKVLPGLFVLVNH